MSRIDGLRANSTYRLSFLAVGTVVGLGLAWTHWLGLLVGGALVGLPTLTPKRGILAGFGFGVLSLLVFSGLLALHGSLSHALGMGQITALAVAIPLVFGTVGGLARTLV
ncbi:hypothetical protein [Haladaptatus sp. DYF46]|uniref:hypothetical protein n=1 Tax=Haladaptatus sp. DYF46 TaxID=2886041 RepID=UPI001E58A4EC|nr:hypothetical protein [Haladaptatus sp. DYF46]